MHSVAAISLAADQASQRRAFSLLRPLTVIGVATTVGLSALVCFASAYGVVGLLVGVWPALLGAGLSGLICLEGWDRCRPGRAEQSRLELAQDVAAELLQAA